MLACPSCRTRLAKQPSPEGPRWICPRCAGRAVHLPSLRCSPAGAFVRRLRALARHAPAADRTRGCPICGALMATVPTIAVPGAADPLRLDVCLSCEFVWFDPAEHEAWVRASSLVVTEGQLPPETRAALARLPPAPPPPILLEPAEDDEPGFVRLVQRDEGFELKYALCLLGLPVEVEPPPLAHRPWATWTLAAVVTIVSLAAFADIRQAVAAWGFIPAQMWRHGGLTLVTPFFLHGGFMHLFGNMYFLVALGDNVEDLFGVPRYLLLLLTGTVTGNLIQAAVAPDPYIPAVGASGGIAAVVLCYGLLFPQGRLRFFRLVYFELSAWAALAAWVTIQLVGMIVQITQGTRVAYAAHVGGALGGLACWFFYRK